MRHAVARWLVPTGVLGPWLLLLTSRQVALYPAVGGPGSPLFPVPIVVGVAALFVALRAVRPTTTTHVAFLAVLTCAVALLAAHLGSPLANASGDYCGDFCRSSIMGRFVAFFGWPVVTAGALAVLARRENRGQVPGREVRAAWSRAWAWVTLVLGLVAAAAWWRIILPNG